MSNRVAVAAMAPVGGSSKPMSDAVAWQLCSAELRLAATALVDNGDRSHKRLSPALREQIRAALKKMQDLSAKETQK